MEYDAGFVAAEKRTFPDQPPAAVAAIRAGVSLVPAALAFVAAWLIGYYDLEMARDSRAAT